jgi:hypothetical protein
MLSDLKKIIVILFKLGAAIERGDLGIKAIARNYGIQSLSTVPN